MAMLQVVVEVQTNKTKSLRQNKKRDCMALVLIAAAQVSVTVQKS